MTSSVVNGTGKEVCKLKLAVLGDKQVGKSSLLTRYAKGKFNPIYLHTRGGDIVEKKLKINGINMELSIVDSAGHHYVRSLIKTLYRNVHGIMIVYDVTREKTFDSLLQWLHEITLVNTNNPYIVLVGNKNDLNQHLKVSSERAQGFAAQKGLPLFEVSAKSGDKVKEAFINLIEGTYAEKLPGDFFVDSIVLSAPTDDDEDTKQCCNS